MPSPGEFKGLQVGSYVLSKPLGAGGMGQVYLARHTSLEDRVVAVKLLLNVETATVDSVKRFKREANALNSLEHPHIVQLFDFGYADFEEYSIPFIVMEYLAGGNLSGLIEGSGSLTLGRTVRIFLPIVNALGYAHEEGILHRDLKPANVLFDTNGNPHLADFGLAGLARGGVEHSLDSDEVLTQDGAAVGTPAYIAPEVMQGEEASASSDIYSLGIIWFQCLTARLPSPTELPSRSTQKGQLPDWVDEVYENCVAPREKRLAKVEELEALIQSKIDETSSAPSMGTKSQAMVAPPIERNVPWLPALGAGLGGVCGTVAGAAMYAATNSPLSIISVVGGAALGGIVASMLSRRTNLQQVLPFGSPSEAKPEEKGWLGYCNDCNIPVIRETGRCPVCGSENL